MMNADAGRVFDPYVLKVFFEQVAPRLTWRKVDLAAMLRQLHRHACVDGNGSCAVGGAAEDHFDRRHFHLRRVDHLRERVAVAVITVVDDNRVRVL